MLLLDNSLIPITIPFNSSNNAGFNIITYKDSVEYKIKLNHNTNRTISL